MMCSRLSRDGIYSFAVPEFGLTKVHAKSCSSVLEATLVYNDLCVNGS